MSYHSKEAVLTIILCSIIWIVIGCVALHVGLEIEVNIENEQPTEEEADTEHPAAEHPE